MDLSKGHDNNTAAAAGKEELEMEIRKGPWTEEEDMKLINYISMHGRGRWNSLALSAGLRRTGKNCRFRWLNYLRPGLRRGNITLQEQLLILRLHSLWGNRWSKIAEHLPGRTDNEIKNYWRTKVEKQAKSLKCDVNSIEFGETMRRLWLPRLNQRFWASSQSTISREKSPVISSHNQVHQTEFGLGPIRDQQSSPQPAISNHSFEEAQVCTSRSYFLDANEWPTNFQDGLSFQDSENHRYDLDNWSNDENACYGSQYPSPRA